MFPWINRGLVLFSLLLIAGAGCAPAIAPPTNPEPAAPSPAEAGLAVESLKDFTVQVESLNPGIVKVTWNAPTPSDPDVTYRILHSAKPSPALPSAYWYQRSNAEAREAAIGKLPKGTRYFRVCEFKDNQCRRYSNEAAVEVQ